MDLFNLAAKITLDDKDYVKGIGAAEKLGQNLAGKMSAMTVAVGNLAADMVRKGVAAINGVVTGAIDGYADYQQLIGGVETLFKSSADKVAKYAKQSFKTTGLSANQYMETVTSFSASLLQGLGGDTEAAADLANTAIIDMADNANKMGTDIQSIQNAYQGFAKQNYTMLDNLKLGYGGTAQEMVRLVNDSGILENKIENLDNITFDQLVQAIHEIQKQMGITGTTAEEAASTISGSKASLQAAWADFLASVGGEQDQAKLEEAGDNFKQAFESYVVNNLAPALQTTLENTPELIQAVSDAITSLPSTAISDLLSSGADILTAGIGAAADIGGWLIDGLIGIFNDAAADNSKAEELGSAIGEFIGSSLTKIVTNVGSIFSGILAIGEGLASGLIEGLWNGLFGEGNTEVDGIREELEGKLTEVDEDTIKNTALLEYMKALYEERGAAATATAEWAGALEELKATMPDAESVFKNFGTDVQGAIDHLDMLNKKMQQTAIQNALISALQDEYSLLAKQNMEYRKQEARYNRNQALQDTYMADVRQGIMEAAAQQAKEMWDNSHDANGNEIDFFDPAMYEQLVSLSKGMAQVGNDVMDINEADFEGLSNLVSFLGDDGLKDLLNSRKDLWNESDKEIREAQKAMEEGAKEIEATKTEIEDVKAAMQASAKDLGVSTDELSEEAEQIPETVETMTTNLTEGSSEVKKALEASGTLGAGGIASAADVVTGALQLKATQIANVKIPAVVGEAGGVGGGVRYGGGRYGNIGMREEVLHANGVDFGEVPFNGMRTKLHKGEMVLTKSGAERLKNGMNNSGVLGALQGLRNDLQNMQLVVGEKVFGNAVVDYGGHKVSGYIGRSESRFYAGYGT